jgi:hypothetical protein
MKTKMKEKMSINPTRIVSTNYHCDIKESDEGKIIVDNMKITKKGKSNLLKRTALTALKYGLGAFIIGAAVGFGLNHWNFSAVSVWEASAGAFGVGLAVGSLTFFNHRKQMKREAVLEARGLYRESIIEDLTATLKERDAKNAAEEERRLKKSRERITDLLLLLTDNSYGDV